MEVNKRKTYKTKKVNIIKLYAFYKEINKENKDGNKSK